MLNKDDKVLKPLALSCDTAECDKNLHCFRKTKDPEKEIFPGTCKYCGANLIDWERVHLKNYSDIKYTIDALKKEWIRHKFWHIEIPLRAKNYALRKGKIDLKDTIQKHIKIAIGTAHPFHDGYQTPFTSNNPIHYAQHATATCCRKCVEYWYSIDPNRNLSNKEIEYFSDLILKYFEERIEGLTEFKQKIPSIKRDID